MRSLPVFFALALAPLQGQMPEVRTTAKDRTALSVTIYQNGLAAIRDTRRVSLPAGPSRLAFSDLLPTLRPKSAVLLDPSRDLQVRERNFEFNLLSPASLVDASLGLPVRIKGEDGRPDGAGTLASVPLLNPRLRSDAKPLERLARLKSAYAQPPDPRVVVDTGQGHRTSSPEGLTFLSLPRRLLAAPTLTQELVTPRTSDHALTLLYTATDLTWTPSYIATLSTEGRHLDLDVFATLKNQGSGELHGTLLQLIAGAPNLIYDPPPPDPDAPQLDRTEVKSAAMVEVVASQPAFKEEKLSEYPLFTLDRPVTLAPHSEKQLRLMAVAGIPIHQRLLVQAPYEPLDTMPSAFLEGPLFQPGDDSLWHRHPRVHRTAIVPNTASARLGRALPGGDLLIRYRDPVGDLVILQDEASGYLREFPETPPGGDIEIDLGLARGLHVTRRGIHKRRVPVGWLARLGLRNGSERCWRYQVEVRIRSSLAEPVEMIVREPLLPDWRVLSATHPGRRSGGTSWDFTVAVQPDRESTLIYEVQTSPEKVAVTNP